MRDWTEVFGRRSFVACPLYMLPMSRVYNTANAPVISLFPFCFFFCFLNLFTHSYLQSQSKSIYKYKFVSSNIRLQTELSKVQSYYRIIVHDSKRVIVTVLQCYDPWLGRVIVTALQCYRPWLGRVIVTVLQCYGPWLRRVTVTVLRSMTQRNRIARLKEQSHYNINCNKTKKDLLSHGRDSTAYN